MTTVEKRPKSLLGISYKVPSGLGNLYLNVTWHQGKIFEIFGRMHTSGSNELADLEGICRLASKFLRMGGNVEEIIEQLSGISGDSPRWNEGTLIKSLPDAVAYALNLARLETKAVHLWRLRTLLSSTGIEFSNEQEQLLIKYVNILISDGEHYDTFLNRESSLEFNSRQQMMLKKWEEERVRGYIPRKTRPPMQAIVREYNRRLGAKNVTESN